MLACIEGAVWLLVWVMNSGQEPGVKGVQVRLQISVHMAATELVAYSMDSHVLYTVCDRLREQRDCPDLVMLSDHSAASSTLQCLQCTDTLSTAI